MRPQKKKEWRNVLRTFLNGNTLLILVNNSDLKMAWYWKAASCQKASKSKAFLKLNVRHRLSLSAEPDAEQTVNLTNAQLIVTAAEFHTWETSLLENSYFAKRFQDQLFSTTTLTCAFRTFSWLIFSSLIFLFLTWNYVQIKSWLMIIIQTSFILKLNKTQMAAYITI